jgi:glycine cleavage system H protein
MENEFLSIYAAKLVEYGLAVVYMVLFVGYWRWVQGAPRLGTNGDTKQAGRAS